MTGFSRYLFNCLNAELIAERWALSLRAHVSEKLLYGRAANVFAD